MKTIENRHALLPLSYSFCRHVVGGCWHWAAKGSRSEARGDCRCPLPDSLRIEVKVELRYQKIETSDGSYSPFLNPALCWTCGRRRFSRILREHIPFDTERSWWRSTFTPFFLMLIAYTLLKLLIKSIVLSLLHFLFDVLQILSGEAVCGRFLHDDGSLLLNQPIRSKSASRSKLTTSVASFVLNVWEETIPTTVTKLASLLK